MTPEGAPSGAGEAGGDEDAAARAEATIRGADTDHVERATDATDATVSPVVASRTRPAAASTSARPRRTAHAELSSFRRNGSGSIGSPPSYQPGAVQSSKWRWQPDARPVSPISPTCCPASTRSPLLTIAG